MNHTGTLQPGTVGRYEALELGNTSHVTLFLYSQEKSLI